MADPMFTASVDNADVLALFDRIAQSADFVCKEVARETAKRIVAEAQRRVARASGETSSEVHWEMTRDGLGYVVLAYDTRVNKSSVDKYLETGTQFMHAKPFFFAAVELEAPGHLSRLEERLQDFLDEVGR
jgi:hypothetical protein